MTGPDLERPLAVRTAQADYLTAKAAAGNLAGACCVPLLLMATLPDADLRATAQCAYERCASAMAAMDALVADLGEHMARVQHAP